MWSRRFNLRENAEKQSKLAAFAASVPSTETKERHEKRPQSTPPRESKLASFVAAVPSTSVMPSAAPKRQSPNRLAEFVRAHNEAQHDQARPAASPARPEREVDQPRPAASPAQREKEVDPTQPHNRSLNTPPNRTEEVETLEDEAAVETALAYPLPGTEPRAETPPPSPRRAASEPRRNRPRTPPRSPSVYSEKLTELETISTHIRSKLSHTKAMSAPFVSKAKRVSKARLHAQADALRGLDDVCARLRSRAVFVAWRQEQPVADDGSFRKTPLARQYARIHDAEAKVDAAIAHLRSAPTSPAALSPAALSGPETTTNALWKSDPVVYEVDDEDDLDAIVEATLDKYEADVGQARSETEELHRANQSLRTQLAEATAALAVASLSSSSDSIESSCAVHPVVDDDQVAQLKIRLAEVTAALAAASLDRPPTPVAPAVFADDDHPPLVLASLVAAIAQTKDDLARTIDELKHTKDDLAALRAARSAVDNQISCAAADSGKTRSTPSLTRQLVLLCLSFALGAAIALFHALDASVVVEHYYPAWSSAPACAH